MNYTTVDTLVERRSKALMPSYEHFYDRPVYLVKGDGVWLWDSDGRKYLDCYNNVASVGHCHPQVVEALSTQAQTLNTHTRYLHHSVVEYAEALTSTLPGELSMCMLVCTGTEANDLAYQISRSVTGNEGAIIVNNTYHGGSTLVRELSPEDRNSELADFVVKIDEPNPYRGTVSGDDPMFAQHYAGLVDGAIDTLNARGKAPAMLIVDSIYDGSGIFTPPPEYQQQLFAKVRSAGALIVADEVQSGLCRLGDHYWGVMGSGVVPDIITMGKPMGNGHPLAVVVTTPAIAEAYAAASGSYFNTFGGNPVAATTGLAVLKVVETENLLENARQTGHYLKSGLQELASRHELIGDVRGKGLFLAVELVSDRHSKQPAAKETHRVVEWMKDNGVLISKIGVQKNILKIRPPLVFAKEHADIVLNKLDDALSSCR